MTPKRIMVTRALGAGRHIFSSSTRGPVESNHSLASIGRTHRIGKSSSKGGPYSLGFPSSNARSYTLSSRTNVTNTRTENEESFSSMANSIEKDDEAGPTGDLFHAEIGEDLVGKYAKIKRIFSPNANANAMLLCGGPALARHASFDPAYSRAKEWIQHHPVGPAVVGPVLISGLIGALVEAAVPRGVPISSSMKRTRPLIVGVEMEAKIIVQSVKPTQNTGEEQPTDTENEKGDDCFKQSNGYEITFYTEATRVRDGGKIAEGTHCIWVADYS